MSMIKNLETDENGWFANGTFDSDSLFQGECSVSIFLDDVQPLKMLKNAFHIITT